MEAPLESRRKKTLTGQGVKKVRFVGGGGRMRRGGWRVKRARNPGKAGMVILIDFSTALEMTGRSGDDGGKDESRQGRDGDYLIDFSARFARSK